MILNQQKLNSFKTSILIRIVLRYLRASFYRHIFNRACHTASTILVIFSVIGVISPVNAAIIVNNDFNDGTTQGWSSSGTATNEGNELRFSNFAGSGTAALQVNGPFLPFVPSDWTGATQISFDMEFTSLEGIAAPGDLVLHSFSIASDAGCNCAGPFGMLSWELDVTGWALNERRFFTLNIADGVFFTENPELSGITTPANVLENIAFVGMVFSRDPNEFTVGSGLMDNFQVTSTVIPVPAAVWLFGFGLLSLVGMARKPEFSKSY